MLDAITNFFGQFSYQPKVENAVKLAQKSLVIVSGMGGSHLAADLLKNWDPTLDIIVHSDYGVPALPPERLSNALFVASSHSGNTEEVIDGLTEAVKQKMPVAVIATGGTLLETAKATGLPYIQLPSEGIQPRSALGYSMLALLKLLGRDDGMRELGSLASMNAKDWETEGKALAARIKGFVPVVYSSAHNVGIAYNWKIKFNETGKIPAFFNVFPELNHNEMTGFDRNASSESLSKPFYVIILTDGEDDSRVQKRMQILDGLYRNRGINTELVALRGGSRFDRIFTSLILADWAAFHTASGYGADPTNVPIVEEFKRLIA